MNTSTDMSKSEKINVSSNVISMRKKMNMNMSVNTNF